MSSTPPDEHGAGGTPPEQKQQPEMEKTYAGPQNNNVDPDEPAPTAPSPPKPSLMARLGLDPPTVRMMVKGAIAPTIALSIGQAGAVADYFSTMEYLVGIISILAISIMPRGKFLQTLTLNVLFASFGAAMGLLIMWSALQARLHTPSQPLNPKSGLPPYNSSQAAVSGVWLFVMIWFVNTLRAKFPPLNLPVILFSIFINIAATYSPLMTSTAAIERLVRRILTSMLTGLGLAAACNLLIFPVSSRKVTFGQMKGMIMLMRGAVKQEKLYMQSLEREDMFAVPQDVSCGVDGDDKNEKTMRSKKDDSEGGLKPVSAAEAAALKATVMRMRDLLGKLQADLAFAKRDIAWGKMEACDLQKVFSCLRSCTIPIIGMSTVIDIFQRLAEKRNWITGDQTIADELTEKIEDKRIWNEVMRQLHEPFEALSEVVDQGLEHAGILLELLPKPKTSKKPKGAEPAENADVEASGGLVRPGDPGFAKVLEEKVDFIKNVKGKVLTVWARERGLIKDGTEDTIRTEPLPNDDLKHRRDQSQLYLLLYIETLMQEAAEGAMSFVALADERVASGCMAKNRLLFPKYKRIRKWVKCMFSDDDQSAENSADIFDTPNVVYIGDGFSAKKDPEHLPPTNAWERFGNGIRIVNRFFGSEQSMFGLRVACATMTIGIINFLESSQAFFTKQRFVWAMIMVSFSMTESSGQSIFGFLCRVGGTLVAMILSLIAWYIVDEKVPGIIVFYFLFIVIVNYFFIKYPQVVAATIICCVTLTLIIGYELQVLKIGVAVSESAGQPYYPIYLLAPYRLATVAGGCFVAFIWTIFPSPITERSWMRRDLAAAMYLLGHYFTAINETLKARLNDTGGDPEVKTSPAHRLQKMRRKLLGKLLLLLPSLQQHAQFQRFEPTLGGRFPRETYLDIIQRATRLTSYLTLISHTVTWSSPSARAEDRAWIHALAVLLTGVSSTKDAVICTLALLSNSLLSGNPLPPNMLLPRPYELTRQLEALGAVARFVGSGGEGTATEADTDGGAEEEQPRARAEERIPLLDARNISQNGYAEFAVLQVCSSLVCDDLEGLVESVGKLVGVLDFSFRVEGSSLSSLGSTGTSTVGGAGGPGTESEATLAGRRRGSTAVAKQ